MGNAGTFHVTKVDNFRRLCELAGPCRIKINELFELLCGDCLHFFDFGVLVRISGPRIESRINGAPFMTADFPVE